MRENANNYLRYLHSFCKICILLLKNQKKNINNRKEWEHNYTEKVPGQFISGSENVLYAIRLLLITIIINWKIGSNENKTTKCLLVRSQMVNNNKKNSFNAFNCSFLRLCGLYILERATCTFSPEHLKRPRRKKEWKKANNWSNECVSVSVWTQFNFLEMFTYDA